MSLPTGDGIGATHVVCEVISLVRAIGFLHAITLVEPIAIMPGPAGIHDGNIQGKELSMTTAAGILPTITVAAPGPVMDNGKAGWGTGVGTGAGGWIGA